MVQTKTDSRRALLLKAVALLLLSALLVACETIGYYGQAARGQLGILLAREDIQRLLADEDLAPELAARFQELLAIREFAATELALPVGSNYSTYVDVGREHVVWNVFAAEEFSTDALTWCYPIAGCVAYRGYFSEQGARRYAERLQADGYDVYMGGVDAYSTLGWFDDSLLSTVLDRELYQLAGLIFHELAHQVVYLPGDTTFNESFATTVEREGVDRWLRASGRTELLPSARLSRSRQELFVALVTDYRHRLAELYAEELAEAELRAGKARIQDELRAAYEILKAQWQGYAGYDNWFAQELNNAQLATVGSYNDLVPFFQDLLADSEGDFRVFFSRVQAIADSGAEEREALLAETY